jgi:hypothetical protein
MALDLSALAGEYEDLEAMAEAEELEEGDAERISAIHALAEELGYGDIGDASRAGVDLIAEDDFEEHARETAEQVSECDFNNWPLTCIDWKQAAEELQSDYSSIEFDGITYYTRG